MTGKGEDNGEEDRREELDEECLLAAAVGDEKEEECEDLLCTELVFGDIFDCA